MNPAPRKRQCVTSESGNMAARFEGTRIVSDLPDSDVATRTVQVNRHAGTLDNLNAETSMSESCHHDEKVSNHPRVGHCNCLIDSPYVLLQDALSVRMRRIEHNVRTTNERVVSRVDTFEDNISEQLRSIKELIGKARPTIHAAAVPPCSPAPSPSQLDAPGPTRHAVRTAVTPPGPGCISVTCRDSVPPVTTPSQLGDSIPDENVGTTRLDNEVFLFDKTKVPDPPTIHLSKDIDRLCREWEDSTLLVVNGRSIPVKYWPEFYKKGKGAKTSVWQALRVEWGNWKVRHHGASASLCRYYL